MEEFKEAMMELIKIQTECLEEKQWLDQKRYEKQNGWKKCSTYRCWKNEQGSTNSFLQDSVINSISKSKYSSEERVMFVVYFHHYEEVFQKAVHPVFEIHKLRGLSKVK